VVVDEGRAIAGPFILAGPVLQIWPGKKSRHFDQFTADGVALGSWCDRDVMAVAHNNRARVADVKTGQPLGSPDTGDSEIVAVAVGDIDGRSLLVTGSRGGRVGLWEAPSLRRVASLTLDTAIDALWLAGNVVIARGGDYRFHILDVETSPKSG
jgi:WD40 repeat protein